MKIRTQPSEKIRFAFGVWLNRKRLLERMEARTFFRPSINDILKLTDSVAQANYEYWTEVYKQHPNIKRLVVTGYDDGSIEYDDGSDEQVNTSIK